MKRVASLISLISVLAISQGADAARPQRILKFSGVPISQATSIKKRFPFVFEREVTLGEVDEVVRFLMKTGDYSNIEVIERTGSDGERELVLVASILRKIRQVEVKGLHVFTEQEALDFLEIEKDKPFERKDLIASADELRRAYERLGYHNTKVEIEFGLPSDNEVDIQVIVTEGAPIRIQNVSFETSNPGLLKRLKRMGLSLKNEILNDDVTTDFQKSINTYLQDNRYLTARLSSPTVSYNKERTEAKLSYAVENPWRLEFMIDGNQHFTDWDIIRQLELDKLSGATSSPAPDLADRIRRAYQAAGFANIHVEYNEQFIEEDFIQRIYFVVEEGKRVRIRKVEVNGNISRPEKYYSNFINGTNASFAGKGFYNRREIDESGKRLINELQNQGYLRARIQSQRAEYSKDKSNVTIYLTIDEGPLTQIRQIKFTGAESFTRERLLNLLSVKSGSALSLSELEESLQALKNFYRSEGFLEMKVQNENEQSRIVTYNESNTQATVEFQIYEGPKVVVADVSLQGNTFTKDEVILRELDFGKGDVLTPERIENSVGRLQRLGLFSKVSVKTLEDGTQIANRTAIVEVGERDPGLVTIGLGVNNEQRLTFRGYLGVAYRNIAGTGRAISFRVDPKYSTDPRVSFVENRITLSYLEPYIFGDRNRGRINLLREQSFFNFDEEGRAVIQEENAIGLLLERDLTQHIKLTYTGYNFSNQRQFDRATLDTRQTQNIAKTGPLIEVDFRDDIFNPSKGSYSFLNFEYSNPTLGSSDDSNQEINFLKANASVTRYDRLFGRNNFVWANSVRGGYLKNLGTKPTAGVPSQEAFFLGGRSTIRGFDVGNELEKIPNKNDLGVSDLLNFRVTGESYYYLLKTELRFPIRGPAGGAIFYDGGAVIVSQPGVTLTDPYRHSAGVGLRFATPVGPVGFEFAWKLDMRPYESPWAFHFSIGAF